MHPTVAANHRHRNDELTGAWVKLDRNTYGNFEGYKICRHKKNPKRWVVYAPSGARITREHFSEPTLTWAKFEARQHMAATTLASPVPDLVGVLGDLEPHAVHEAFTTDDNEHGPCLGFTIDNCPDFDVNELINVIMEAHGEVTPNLTKPQIDRLRNALNNHKIEPHDEDSMTVYFPDVRVQQVRASN